MSHVTFYEDWAGLGLVSKCEIIVGYPFSFPSFLFAGACTVTVTTRPWS